MLCRYTLYQCNRHEKGDRMSILGYLLIALSLMTFIYVFYRHSFLKRPKIKGPLKPHFTLKIEGDQT